MIRLCVCLLLVLALGAGCSRSPAWLDQRDRSLPLVQRAAAQANTGDIEAAVRLYTKAIEEDPDAARAHLDLAFLLQEHRKDYAAAIYHYRRYLELRPGSEKQEMVKDRIRLAEQLFAADVLGPSRQTDKIAALEKENGDLRLQLSNLSARVSAGMQQQQQQQQQHKGAESWVVSTSAKAAPPTVTTETSSPPAATATRRPQVSTYRVLRGDTLSSIATTVYGDGTRWKEIQLANSDILGNSSTVKAGQVLLIP